jgi:hypothetical protein
MSVKFMISAEFFGGYTVTLDPSEFVSVKDIIDFCQTSLVSYLSPSGMYMLIDRATKLKLYVHGLSFEEIKKYPTQNVFLCECQNH